MSGAGSQEELVAEETAAAEETPEGIAAAMGPFEPPADFRLEPEFVAASPRPIPAILKTGSHERRWRQRAAAGLMVAVFGLLLGNTPWVVDLGYYILALQYLDWIAWGLLGCVAVAAILHFTRPGPYLWVRDGVPVPARVLRTGIYTEESGPYVSFGHLVLIECRDPESRRPVFAACRSPSIDWVSKAPRYGLPIRPGDHVTAVGLPGRFQESLRLYGFLGLNPAVEYILKDGKPARALPTWAVVALVAGVIGFLGLTVAALYAIEFLIPQGNPAPAAIAAGIGTALGLFAGAALHRAGRRRSPAAVERPRQQMAMASVAGAFLGAIAGFIAVCILNASFDGSAPKFRDVRIVNFWQETWYPLFVRNYKIEYSGIDGGESEKLPARAQRMEEFVLGLGVIEVGEGALGMEWVRGIHPVALVPLEPGEPEERAAITVDAVTPTGEPRKIPLRAVMDLGGGRHLPASDAMVEQVRRLAQEKK